MFLGLNSARGCDAKDSGKKIRERRASEIKVRQKDYRTSKRDRQLIRFEDNGKRAILETELIRFLIAQFGRVSVRRFARPPAIRGGFSRSRLDNLPRRGESG